MTMKVWYAGRSSAFLALWALEEIGEPYERVRLDLSKGETRTPEFLKLNPNGKVPTFQHDDIVIWESMAIADYLSGTFPKANLLPGEPRTRAEVLKWLYYGVVTLQPATYTVGYDRMWKPEAKRIEAAAAEAAEKLQAPLAVLETSLASREYVAGAFSLADFPYASLMLLPKAGVSTDAYPGVKAYLARLKARPAYARAMAID